MDPRYSYSNKKCCPDRFIPTRSNTNVDMSYFKLHFMKDKDDMDDDTGVTETYFNFVQFSSNKQKYQKQLSACLLLNQERILNFSLKNVKKTESFKDEWKRLWPVIPRKKSLLKSPTFILDMPDINTRLDAHVLDWSAQGYVATIFDKEVHLWHPEKKLNRQVTNTGRIVKNCVRWNKNGDQFAMALKFGMVGIVDIDRKMSIIKLQCKCDGQCVVQAIDWSKDNLLVTCCSFGKILVHDKNWKVIASRYEGPHKIINAKLSCNGNFLVTSNKSGKVTLYNFPSLKQIMTVNNNLPIRALAWHPWKESLLVVGGTHSLGLLNVTERRFVSKLPHYIDPCFVDSVIFNPISAELVVVYFDFSSSLSGTTYIVVLASFDHLVDGIRFRSERIPYLLWDYTGTQLASASADEDLLIWDFFGSPQQKKTYLNKIKRSKPLTTNPMDIVTLMGNSIR